MMNNKNLTPNKPLALEILALKTLDCTVQDFPVQLRPAVNFNERKVFGNNTQPQVDVILLHYTAMESAEKAIDWLCCEESQVSCHYLIDETGKITQMVAENHRAWHAGQGSWAGYEDINSASIGIELANQGPKETSLSSAKADNYPNFPKKQILATIALIKDCLTRHNVFPHHILAHSDIAPNRKIDPGGRFPWQELKENGLGLWVEPTPITSGPYLQLGDQGQAVEALQTLLVLFGYGLEINGNFDESTQNCIAAFQRHFRQVKVDGIADVSTVKTLNNLIIERNATV